MHNYRCADLSCHAQKKKNKKKNHLGLAGYSPIVSIFRPPRNTVCGSCYEGARSILALTQQMESLIHEEAEKPKEHTQKGLSQAFNQLKHLKQMDDALVEKYKFLDALGIAFHQGLHTDVELVPNEGPSVHAHRIVMATKSPVFGNMFEADECKGPHTGSVSFSDMGHDQLKSLVEFLYSGSLSKEKIEEHGHALFIAADKYDIPFLRKTCETHISNSLNPLNALDVLELATMCSATALKETAINAILRHRDEIIFSLKYESFALKNPLLSVEITKALLKNLQGNMIIKTQNNLKL